MDEKGFSLLELLAVFAIMSLIAVITVPRLALWDKTELEMEAALLAAELRYTQEMTYTVQQVHTEFPDNQADGTPRLVLQKKSYYIKHNGLQYHIHTIPDSIRITSNRKEFSFSSGGNADTVTIILQKGNAVRYVIIDVVGRIRVSDIPPA